MNIKSISIKEGFFERKIDFAEQVINDVKENKT